MLIGSAQGRASADDLTVFVSLGLAVEDLAAAELALRVAERDGPRAPRWSCDPARLDHPRARDASRRRAAHAARAATPRDAPAEIYLKLENLQPIGSFKIRGASNAMADVPREVFARRLTATAGNMAQGVAWCARELGIPCTVVVPETAPETKIDAIERLGGAGYSVPFDEWWHAFETTRSFPGVEGDFIHPFDDGVMAGNGTVALEIMEDLPEVDAVLVPGAAADLLRDRGGCALRAPT